MKKTIRETRKKNSNDYTPEARENEKKKVNVYPCVIQISAKKNNRGKLRGRQQPKIEWYEKISQKSTQAFVSVNNHVSIQQPNWFFSDNSFFYSNLHINGLPLHDVYTM